MTSPAIALWVGLITGVTSIVSASLALLGVYLARRLDSGSERARAERERKVESYRAQIVAFFRLREGLRRVATNEPDPGNVDERTEDVWTIGVEWNHAVFATWLHGSPTIAEHVRKLDVRMNELFRLAREQRFTVDEWHSHRETASRLLDGYLDLVRIELELSPHKITSEYKS